MAKKTELKTLEALEPAPIAELKPDRETTKNLRVLLTNDDLIARSRALGDNNSKLEQIEEDKKRVTSQYGSDIKLVKSTIKQLSHVVTSGYELKDILCGVYYDRPTKGKKSIVRLDTGEVVETEEMNHMERQMVLPIIDVAGEENGSDQ
jgi:hypothetical protein